MRRLAMSMLGTSIISASVPASADLVLEYPAWRLENYADGRVIVWNAPVPCGTGRLDFGSDVSLPVQDRFWALILTAKATHRSVGVYYDVTSNGCTVRSFYMEG